METSPSVSPFVSASLNLSASIIYYGVCAKSLQSRPTLCDPMGGTPPDSSVHGILQAKILEWVAMPSSGGSSPPGDRT